MPKKTSKPNDRRQRPAPVSGEAVVWPAGIEKRYGISFQTRWRWERKGQLPPRDIHVGGRSGWKPETLVAYEGVRRERADVRKQLCKIGAA